MELIIDDRSNRIKNDRSVVYLQVWHIPIQQKTSLVAGRDIFCLVGFQIVDIFTTELHASTIKLQKEIAKN